MYHLSNLSFYNAILLIFNLPIQKNWPINKDSDTLIKKYLRIRKNTFHQHCNYRAIFFKYKNDETFIFSNSQIKL